MPGPLILQQPFTFQPQFAPAIATSNPLAAGLVDAILPVGGRVISVWPNQKYDNFTDVNGPTYNTGQRGTSRKYSFASSQYSSRPSAPLQQVKECSFLLFWLPGASASNAGAAFAYGNSGTNNPFVIVGWGTGNNPYWRVQDSAATNQAVTGTGAKLTLQSATSTPHVQVCTRSQSLNFVRTYVDGIIDTNTTATTMGAFAVDRTAVGSLLRAAAGSAQDVFNFYLALVWNRALSPSEVAAISANPWQVFEAPPKRLWAQSSGGSTVTGVGSSTGTSTVSGISASTSAQVASSTGTSTVSGVGASTDNEVGNSTGTSTAAAIGASTSSQVGNAAGTSDAQAFSVSTQTGDGACSGTSTATGVCIDATPQGGGKGGYDLYYYKKRKKAPLKERAEEVKGALEQLQALVPATASVYVEKAERKAELAVDKLEALNVIDQAYAPLIAQAERAIEIFQSRLKAQAEEDDEEEIALIMAALEE